MVFKLFPHTKVVLLKKVYANFVGLSVSVKQLKFFFKSTEVKDGDSADKLGMKDGDKIRTAKTRKDTAFNQQKVVLDKVHLMRRSRMHMTRPATEKSQQFLEAEEM